MNPVTLSTNTTRDPARVWLLRIQLGLYRFPGYPRLAACIRNLEPGNQRAGSSFQILHTGQEINP